MGDTGPCGPSSEIHIDLRSSQEIKKIPGETLVNQDHPLVVEVWNLVFIQFNRLSSGELENLPQKHVDTGMGLERLAVAIQGKSSNYDTDIFEPLIHSVCLEAGVKYGESNEIDIALRVVVDHIRAISFAISDGQLPSNIKAGYVIRRILRRAVRYGFTFLGFKEPFLFKLVPTLATQFEGVFPELPSQQEFIGKVIKEEETSFLKTHENGLKKLDQIRSQGLKAKVIDGQVAFELYDTYGFPLDLTNLIAREYGLTVDQKGFKEAMKMQKERSKQAASVAIGDWVTVSQGNGSRFVGYNQLEAKALILKYREIKDKKKTKYQVVLDNTPFYAESGGQVGDTGNLTVDNESIKVLDTKREHDLIVHLTDQLPKMLDQAVQARVDMNKRNLTQNNHTATHLLHAALRQVLGSHVQQKGSLVNDELLRFDFSHFTKMSQDEIIQVEHMVNLKIRENIQREVLEEVPLGEAKEMGAMALFGEKYGDKVRVVKFDPEYSIELCGGTHVKNTGQIGFFKIISESSIAAGVRRIEALTASAAEDYVDHKLGILDQLSDKLKHPEDLSRAVKELINQKTQLTKELEAARLNQIKGIKEDIKKNIEKKDGLNIVIRKIQVPDNDSLKNLAFQIKNEVKGLFMVLAADIAKKPQIAVVISEDLVKERSLDAGKIVKDLAKLISGGGGGQPFFATAGGKDLKGLEKVIDQAKKVADELF